MSGWFRQHAGFSSEVSRSFDGSSELSRSVDGRSCSYTVRESSRCHSATDAEGNPVQRCEKTREVLRQCIGEKPEVIEYIKEEVEQPSISGQLLPFGDAVRDAGDAFRQALHGAGDDVREAAQEVGSLGVVLGDVLGDVGRFFSIVEKSMGEVFGASAPREAFEAMLGEKGAEEARRGRGQVEVERRDSKGSTSTTFDRYSKDFVET